MCVRIHFHIGGDIKKEYDCEVHMGSTHEETSSQKCRATVSLSSTCLEQSSFQSQDNMISCVPVHVHYSSNNVKIFLINILSFI